MVSLKRFYDLEHEFRQVSERMKDATSVPEIATLLHRHLKIVVEAREIVNQLNTLEPHWSDAK